MGPNGIVAFFMKWLTPSTAGAKYIRFRVGGSNIFSASFTTYNNNQLVRSTRVNMGVQDRQIGNRVGASASAWDSGSSTTSYAGDVTTIDTSVDQTVAFTGQLAVNTDSIIIVPFKFTVEHGA